MVVTRSGVMGSLKFHEFCGVPIQNFLNSRAPKAELAVTFQIPIITRTNILKILRASLNQCKKFITKVRLS
jgi:hypothetical protein